MTEPMSEPVAVPLLACPPHQWSYAPTVGQFNCAKCRKMVQHDEPEYADLLADYQIRLTATPPAPERRSTPEEQASAIARGHALDVEDGGYPAPESRVPAALWPFIKHAPDCVLNGHWMEAADHSCDCGLVEALATFDQAVPSGVDGLVTEAELIAGPELARHLEAFWRESPSLEDLGCWLSNHSQSILAALSPVPASAYQVMRDALEQIVHLSCNSGGWFEQDEFGEYCKLGDIAREALTKSPPQETEEG